MAKRSSRLTTLAFFYNYVIKPVGRLAHARGVAAANAIKYIEDKRETWRTRQIKKYIYNLYIRFIYIIYMYDMLLINIII